MTETDIIVVGGGPAGVISAYTAAKSGHSVILVDPKSRDEIGNKTCGDALDLEPCKFIKDKLGLEYPHDDETSDIVKALVFQAGEREIPIEGEKLGFIVNRHNYGQRLLKEAEKAGVEIRDKIKVLNALTRNTTVTGVKYKNLSDGSIGKIDAKITIDCSGYKYIVRKTLSKDKFPLLEHDMPDNDVMPSYREIIQLKEGIENHSYRHKIYLIYMKDIPTPGYFWVFTEGDYKLNTGICYFKNAKTKESMKVLYQRILERDYYTSDQYEVIHGKGYQIPTRYPLMNAVATGFLTAGDAAHHVDPFTAEGHGPALIAGYYAGKTAVEAIEANDVSQDFLWSYNKAIMDHFGMQQCKTQVFTEALRRIGASGIEFIFKREILTKEEYLALNEGKRPETKALLSKLIRLFPKYNILPIVGRVAQSTTRITEIISDYPTSPNDFVEWNSRFTLLMNKVRK